MIVNRQRLVRVALRPLEEFLHRVQDELGLARAEITVALVSDLQIAQMNQTYRKKSGPTDVLSFPAVERRKPAPLRRGRVAAVRAGYLGDIAISPATARRNAAKRGRPLVAELRVLILHGVLHLLGYDHETDRGEMERLERRLRRRLEIT